MLNTEHVFKRLDLGATRTEAVQKIRAIVEEAADPIAKAVSLIKDMIGLEPKYEDATRARLVAQKTAEEAFKANHQIENETDFLKSCEDYVTKFMADPKNAFMFAKDSPTAVAAEKVEVVKGMTKVEVKANGKIKKGGKQVLAAELYTKHVLQAKTPATNQEFIGILVKELGMSKAGATTYAYNCKKQLGEPEGGIVKAKKGRKAKALQVAGTPAATAIVKKAVKPKKAKK